MRGSGRGCTRLAASLLYLGFARHLPWSTRPFGRVSRRLRAMLAGHMLDRCGVGVNVEHGAWFGSGRGIRLGDRSDIGMDALLMGAVSIGADVMMGPRCILVSGRHDIRDSDIPMNQQGFLDDLPIVIEDDVWLGAGCVILPGRRVGRGAVVGAGSVVAHDVAPHTVVGGNPATLLRRRRPPDGGGTVRVRDDEATPSDDQRSRA